MSEIPEITESQLKTMLLICNNPDMSVFSQCAPKDSDPLALQCVMGQGAKDTEYLVYLKLLKEITADHMEQINRTNAESGRTWRVFEITALGRAMFQAYTHPGVN
jgi:hypothetical protein